MHYVLYLQDQHCVIIIPASFAFPKFDLIMLSNQNVNYPNSNTEDLKRYFNFCL